MFVSYWLSMISIHASCYLVCGECVHFERGKVVKYHRSWYFHEFGMGCLRLIFYIVCV